MIEEGDEWQPPRKLKVFAFDPTTAKAYANRMLREVDIVLPWEMDPDIGLGPTGEYLEVVDYDPASRCFYNPVDLDDPKILANGGLDPSESDPRFHQQMVYAVAMNTIATFEEALGRKILWADDTREINGKWQSNFVQRLRIYPHALREANAYYCPKRKILLFGYFEAPDGADKIVSGTSVFTCLSHDIIVHETVHAILDGIHPRFAEASHPDMRALHEAFADIVAIFQLFSFPEVLEEQIARTKGDLESQSMLAQLAQEFGQALGRSDALRDALGEEKDGKWKIRTPDASLLDGLMSPHARGSILVAAIFRAFLNVYKGKTEDLFRIASGGSGILREGAVDPDLGKRLAREAASIARRILRICIRGFDYVPPVAVSFGDYLRAIMTADHDLFPEDEDGYRTAILEAFTSWGIVPEGMSIVTRKRLLWPTLSQTIDDLRARRELSGEDVSVEAVKGELGAIITRPREVFESYRIRMKAIENDSGQDFVAKVREDRRRLTQKANDRISHFDEMRSKSKSPTTPLYKFKMREPDEEDVASEEEKDMQPALLVLGESLSREAEYDLSQYYSRMIWMLANAQVTEQFAKVLGITFDENAPRSVRRSKITELPSLHVMPVRRARRIGRRNQIQDEYVIELVQTRYGFFDLDRQAEVDANGLTRQQEKDRSFDFLYRAGATVLVDAAEFDIRRLIRTPYAVDDDRGLDKLRAFRLDNRHGIRNAFNDGDPGANETAFADLHRNVWRRAEEW